MTGIQAFQAAFLAQLKTLSVEELLDILEDLVADSTECYHPAHRRGVAKHDAKLRNIDKKKKAIRAELVRRLGPPA